MARHFVLVRVARLSVSVNATYPFVSIKERRRSPPMSISMRQFWGALGAIALAASAFAGEVPSADRRSGYDFMSRETRAMQDDDTANPGLLWMLEGGTLWTRKTGASGRACVDCHGDASATMQGVAARHPAFDAAKGRPVSLEQRINLCRTDRQQAPVLAWESRELLALAAYVARQSRGLPIDIGVDQRTQPFLDAGRATFHRRQGQLNLACSQCHDANWGRQLAGNVVPQAHPTGYPLYRLEWQGLGSLQRRLRNCLVGMRAEPYEYGAPELVDLELFLMWRARGMTIEAPAVRP
jgi:L-cysteine S-thiosulfotransferase